MARKADGSYSSLIGEYPLLNDTQREYVRIRTDPQSRIDGLSDNDIAKIIGVHLRTIGSWKSKPCVADALVSETNKKSADKTPAVMAVIENIVFKKTPTDEDKIKLAAAKTWLEYNGAKDVAKDKAMKKAGERTTYEDFLAEKQKEYGEELEDDIKAEFGNADEQSEDLYSDTT